MPFNQFDEDAVDERDVDDTEGHGRKRIDEDEVNEREADDTEGHRRVVRFDAEATDEQEAEDDVLGHRRVARG